MSKAVISFRVDEEELALLDRLAAARGRSRSWMVNHLLREAAQEELKLLEDIEEGIADADAGRTISHDEFVAQLEALFPDNLGSKAA
jgi:predicted transcriptional regulator